jgi:hypothetical protein
MKALAKWRKPGHSGMTDNALRVAAFAGLVARVKRESALESR